MAGLACVVWLDTWGYFYHLTNSLTLHRAWNRSDDNDDNNNNDNDDDDGYNNDNRVESLNK